MPSPIQTITLDNTFDEQRKVINQLVVSVNDTDAASNLINVVSNTSTLSVSPIVAKRGVLYIDTNLTSTFTNTSVNVIASAASVNVVHSAVVRSEANSRNVTGTFANATGSAANAYAADRIFSAGIAANNYSDGAASRSATGANAYAVAIGAASNAWTNTVAVIKTAGACNYVNTSISIPAYGVDKGLIIRKQDNAYEGGEFHLEKPTNTILFGNVAFDINGNNLRIFDSGGVNRGIFSNVAAAGSGASSELIHSTNINQFSAKNITDYPLNQDVRSTASPSFPNINVTTGSFRKTGPGAGGFYDVTNQTGLLSVDASYLRTNHSSAPWYNANKQVGMVVEGDLWFNSGYGTNAGKAYGCRAWGGYQTPGTSTNTQAITWWWRTAPASGTTLVCDLNATTCDAMGITAGGTTITLDKNLTYNYQTYGMTFVMVVAGTYTAYKIGTNRFQILNPTTGEYRLSAWSGTNGVTVSKSTLVPGYTTGSGGVSSIVDNGGGIYTVNFDFTMPDSNYAIIAKYLREQNTEFLNLQYSVKNQTSFNLQVFPITPTANYWPFYFAVFR
jgi:hypothetical protein